MSTTGRKYIVAKVELYTVQQHYVLMRQDRAGRWDFPGGYVNPTYHLWNTRISLVVKAQTGLELAPHVWDYPVEETNGGLECWVFAITQAGTPGFLKGQDEHSQGAAWIPVRLLFRTLMFKFSGHSIVEAGQGSRTIVNWLILRQAQEYKQAEREGQEEVAHVIKLTIRQQGLGRAFPRLFELQAEWDAAKIAGATQATS